MTAHAVTLQLLAAPEIDRLLPQLRALHSAAYAPRPWYGSRPPAARAFRTTFNQHRRLPGFRLAAAFLPGGQLVGFGYGYANAAGQWYAENLAARFGASFARHWLTGGYQLAECAVAPAYRRAGIGRALHAGFLDGCAARCVMASVLPRTPGAFFATGLGYEMVAFDVWFPKDSADQYTLLVLRLPER